MMSNYGGKLNAKEARTMKTAGFLMTLGVGMAAGAVAHKLLPRDCEVKKAVDSAADSIGKAAKKAVDNVQG